MTPTYRHSLTNDGPELTERATKLKFFHPSVVKSFRHNLFGNHKFHHVATLIKFHQSFHTVVLSYDQILTSLGFRPVVLYLRRQKSKV